MDFRPVEGKELQALMDALRGNAENNTPIRMNTRDTSFLADPAADEPIQTLINTIKSVPCHY